MSDFVPYFQGQFDRALRMVSAEILMRPLDPKVPTVAEIKNLEESKEISSLDLLGLEAALNFQSAYNIPCSSNFSATSLGEVEVINTLIVRSCHNKLKIELTESGDLNPVAVENLRILNFVGINLSLDDFGSRYNGLNRFVQFPWAELKIDKYLIENLAQPKAEAVVESTIAYCDRLGIETVAEGVEHEWQLDLLLKLGATKLQGYYLHKPEPL